MIDKELIEKALYDWATIMCPGWAIFFTLDDAQRPDANCISFRNTLNKNTTVDALMGPIDPITGVAIYSREKILAYELVSYGSNAMGILDHLINSEQVEHRDKLRDDSGLSILSTSDVIDVSGLNDSIWEERATTTITFTISIQYFHRGPLLDEDGEPILDENDEPVYGDVGETVGIIESVEGEFEAISDKNRSIIIPFLIE